ncbi:ATP-binding protein [Bacillus coahuilensis]|uniref:ATP-binding protein n=1 Tax=Bacillus coahuilensis TaxID=408580 RepID=UPI0009E6845D
MYYDITIKISDNGPGISSSVIHKLGEPFFTTKEDGTGLGLMVSYMIIQDIGGQIKVESYENKGTTFTVKLPMIK